MNLFSKLSEKELKELEEVSRGVPDPYGRWICSKQNLREVVNREIKLPKKIIIVDDTLRSGGNMPYVYITIEDRLEIARKMEEAGIREAVAGYAGLEEHNEFIRQLKDEGTKIKLIAKTRGFIANWEGEIDRAADCGFDAVTFLLGRSGSLGGEVMTEEEHKKRVINCVTHAKEYGLLVHGPSMKEALEAGVDRVGAGDGHGWLRPATIKYNTMSRRDLVGPDVQIGIHCHDDFGLGTANTLAGMEGGADALEVTINGYGHRSGNAEFEQVVLACEALYGVDTGIKVEKIYDLCKFVEEKFKMPIAPNAPFVGKHAYCHGGLHIPPLLGDSPKWYHWETVRAEAIGQTRTWMWHTPALMWDNMGPVTSKIESMGLSFTDDQLKSILDKLNEIVKTTAAASATDEEMEALIREVIS